MFSGHFLDAGLAQSSLAGIFVIRLNNKRILLFFKRLKTVPPFTPSCGVQAKWNKNY
jgi:hypothetical protein